MAADVGERYQILCRPRGFGTAAASSSRSTCRSSSGRSNSGSSCRRIEPAHAPFDHLVRREQPAAECQTAAHRSVRVLTCTFRTRPQTLRHHTRTAPGIPSGRHGEGHNTSKTETQSSSPLWRRSEHLSCSPSRPKPSTESVSSSSSSSTGPRMVARPFLVSVRSMSSQ